MTLLDELLRRAGTPGPVTLAGANAAMRVSVVLMACDWTKPNEISIEQQVGLLDALAEACAAILDVELKELKRLPLADLLGVITALLDSIIREWPVYIEGEVSVAIEAMTAAFNRVAALA